MIPQEAGLNERAVSFTKGCYVGQETVARLYYRGKPNRRLLGLRLSEPVEPGTELKLGEKVVGKLGSVVVSPDHGPIALALVRREANPGDTVDLDGFDGTHSRRPVRAVKSVQHQQFGPKGAAHGRSRDRARQPHRRGA